jgi:hypothetical protein
MGKASFLPAVLIAVTYFKTAGGTPAPRNSGHRNVFSRDQNSSNICFF